MLKEMLSVLPWTARHGASALPSHDWQIEQTAHAINDWLMELAVSLSERVTEAQPLSPEHDDMVRRMFLISICKAFLIHRVEEVLDHKSLPAQTVARYLAYMYSDEFNHIIALAREMAPRQFVFLPEGYQSIVSPLDAYRDTVPGMDQGVLTYQLSHWVYDNIDQSALMELIHRQAAVVTRDLEDQLYNQLTRSLTVSQK